LNTPTELKYSKTDEWVKVAGKKATIGITDYAQGQLSDVVFVEILVGIGDVAKKSSSCATIESVKAAADVTMPVTGKVTAINEPIAEKPELVNSDPFGKAWMVEVELTNPAELDALMDAAAYEKYCQERSH
jgi:glycine cleavage system H protein